MAVTNLLGLPIPQMSDTVGKTIPDLASAMQIIDEKLSGSRIVDHNLDVVNPENGYYWRRQDGAQVCWTFQTGFGAQQEALDDWTWTYPAAFNVTPYLYSTSRSSSPTGAPLFYVITSSLFPVLGPTQATFYAYRPEGLRTNYEYCYALAIGTWK